METLWSWKVSLFTGQKVGLKEYIAICGARLESQKLINAVVEAYKHGHLTEFAAEIEQYYLPAYAPDFEEEMEDEELPDDDGRYDAFV